MQILVGKHSGFCFGVQRAVRLAEEAAKNGAVYTYGNIIHNEDVVEELRQKGIVPVSDLESLKPGDTLIIRAHGAPPELYAKCESLGLHLIDATCPFVAKIHRIVQRAAEAGEYVYIAGKREHPEVIGIVGSAGENVCVLPDAASALLEPKTETATLVSQTTQKSETFEEIRAALSTRVETLHVFNTICDTTRLRQEEAAALLGECTNIRDYFLVYLLFETGMRIGEALSLWLEDFDLDGLKISITDRGELQNLAEIKTVHSPRKLDCTQDLADLFMGYVCEVHTCDINTNHVFLKLRGENAGKPMDYSDVDNLFRTLRKKTGIQITPHVFRHTSLSLLYADGWAPELLRIRAGHKNIYTTINTYIHPTEEELTAAFNKAAPHLSRPDLGRKEGDA